MEGDKVGVVVLLDFYDDVYCVVDEGVDGYGGEDDIGGDLKIKSDGCEEEV